MSHHMKTVTGGANAISTLTLTLPKMNNNSGKLRYQIRVHSITVTTSEADLGADIAVLATSGTGETWKAFLRTDKVFGGHFEFSSCPLPSKGADMVITASAGGALCKTTISAAYEII
jgi:hypothetical protein